MGHLPATPTGELSFYHFLLKQGLVSIGTESLPLSVLSSHKSQEVGFIASCALSLQGGPGRGAEKLPVLHLAL